MKHMELYQLLSSHLAESRLSKVTVATLKKKGSLDGLTLG